MRNPSPRPRLTARARPVALAALGWLCGCAPVSDEQAESAGLRVTFARLTNDGCGLPSGDPTGAAPRRPEPLGGIDAIVLQRFPGPEETVPRDPDGWTRVAWIDQLAEDVEEEEGAEGEPQARERFLEGVPAGPTRFRAFACVAGEPTHVAHVAPFELGANAKHYINLHFRKINASTCTGTSFGPDYDRYSGLGRARAFGVSAPLSDGRWLVAGGASTRAGAALRGASGGHAWDIYDPYESLFLHGLDRARPVEPRAMLAARVGAVAVPLVGGVLVVGGVTETTWAATQFPLGPLSVKASELSAPAAEYFSFDTGRFGPVAGESLRARGFAGADSVLGGPAVIAGGLEADGAGGVQPSRRVEIIAGDTVATLDLPTGLVGATVTAVGTGRFLIWGGDITGCGAAVGFVVSTTPPGVTPVALDATPPVPSCAAPAAGCRAWTPTAYHAAARLAPREGRERVLITGGIPLRNRGAGDNTPDLAGGGCPANAFVVSLDPATGAATLEAVEIPGELQTSARRALHTATSAPDGVLLTGGWVNGGTPTALNTTDEVLRHLDRPTAAPGGTLERVSGQATAPQRQAHPRLGHFAFVDLNGAALFAGGVDATNGEFEIESSAEVWVPGAPSAVCAPPEVPLEP